MTDEASTLAALNGAIIEARAWVMDPNEGNDLAVEILDTLTDLWNRWSR